MKTKLFGFLVVLLIAFALTACDNGGGGGGGNGGSGGDPTVTSVTVSGGAESVQKGSSTPAFTATVTGRIGLTGFPTTPQKLPITLR